MFPHLQEGLSLSLPSSSPKDMVSTSSSSMAFTTHRCYSVFVCFGLSFYFICFFFQSRPFLDLVVLEIVTSELPVPSPACPLLSSRALLRHSFGSGLSVCPIVLVQLDHKFWENYQVYLKSLMTSG